MKMEVYAWEHLRFKVSSESREGVEYLVDLSEEQALCECADFVCVKNKLKSKCKHIKRVEEWLLEKFLTELRHE